MNNYKTSSKILFSIVVAVIVVSWSLSAAISNVYIQKAMALTATTTNTAFGLQNPFYTEYDAWRPVVVSGIKFLGLPRIVNQSLYWESNDFQECPASWNTTIKYNTNIRRKENQNLMVFGIEIFFVITWQIRLRMIGFPI